ncbi:MAG: hypothetical protein IJU18_03350, partial [Oscillospiraceae bacterium]|nr:hypothetical protein [Oscillospiraceae bacterium]
MKKRLLSWLMVCAMLVSLLPVIATAEDAVAFVGEDGYATLAEAVEAAGAGDTITLKGDVEIAAPITVDKDLTIEADGDRTIYQAANIASLFTINGGAVATTITVAFSAPDGHYLTFSGKNGGTQYTANSAMLYIRYANVTGTNLKFVDGNGGSNAAAVNIAAGSFTMNNCHIQRCTSASTSYGGVMYVTYANKTSGVVTMNGGSVTDCSSSSGLSLVQVAQGGSGAYAGIFNGNGTTFSHNTVTGGPLIKVNGKVALDGCSFSENTASYAVLTGNTYFAAGRTVANCTFDTEQEDTLSGNITATDNTFPVPETVVAKIGEQGFSTLAGAVAAASAGDVITLVDDAELSARLTIDKALTIETDGVADRTIRAADAINQHMIYVGGSAKSAFTMTFRGSEGSRLIIDADGNAARAALCVEKADAVLSCVNIINGSSTSGSHCGGLYVTNGVVTADHVILQNNQTTATGGYGGAVHITATGGLFMTNCAVTGNTAVNETAKGSDGHSIIRVNGDFSATDCVFTNNTVFINDGSTYYTSDQTTLRTNGYIISAANDTDTYTRLIQNCVFDTTEKTAVDVTNGMVWVLRGNIYADAGRTSGSQTVLAALPDLSVMDADAVLYGYLTNGSDKTGNSPASGETEEITWRLTGGDKVTADYAAYTAALEGAGYTAYTSNTIGANL